LKANHCGRGCDGGRVPLPEIAEITGQICDALNAAHNRGIVHRDIKPENVFLSQDDDGLLVKVPDFGVAMLKEFETRTATNACNRSNPTSDKNAAISKRRKNNRR
jgi:serine/threonine protein kinase